MFNTAFSRVLGKDDVFVITTLDGSDTLFNKESGATYHSVKGAVSESRHVFLQHGLQQLNHLSSISILEIGLGTGLNAFLAFLFAQKNRKTVSYSGIEPFPIEVRVATQLNYPSYLAAESSRDIFIKIHQETGFSFGYFNFNKYPNLIHADANDKPDVIFFDAFSPDVHPQLWEQNIFDHLFERTSKGGLIVTYCAKGEIRRRIEKAGYRVKRLAGAPGKREMIQGIKI